MEVYISAYSIPHNSKPHANVKKQWEKLGLLNGIDIVVQRPTINPL
jgi:hypothetical protein